MTLFLIPYILPLCYARVSKGKFLPHACSFPLITLSCVMPTGAKVNHNLMYYLQITLGQPYVMNLMYKVLEKKGKKILNYNYN